MNILFPKLRPLVVIHFSAAREEFCGIQMTLALGYKIQP